MRTKIFVFWLAPPWLNASSNVDAERQNATQHWNEFAHYTSQTSTYIICNIFQRMVQRKVRLPIGPLVLPMSMQTSWTHSAKHVKTTASPKHLALQCFHLPLHNPWRLGTDGSLPFSARMKHENTLLAMWFLLRRCDFSWVPLHAPNPLRGWATCLAQKHDLHIVMISVSVNPGLMKLVVAMKPCDRSKGEILETLCRIISTCDCVWAWNPTTKRWRDSTCQTCEAHHIISLHPLNVMNKTSPSKLHPNIQIYLIKSYHMLPYCEQRRGCLTHRVET